MKRSRFKAIVFCLLAVAIQSACFSLVDGSPGRYEIQETSLSPKARFKAIAWIGMGGGAAGWCRQKVSILPASEELPLNTTEEKERIEHVFSVRCSSDIKITWIDDTLVKIGYTLSDDPIPTSLSQAGSTTDGRVKVVYEIVDKGIK